MIQKDSKLILEKNKTMTPDLYDVLNLAYLPLMGDEAYLFYTTLLSIVDSHLPIHNHLLLQRLTRMNYETMEKARETCEKFLLVYTFYNEAENTYLYIVNTPMSIDEFLGHEVYGKLFLNAMGKDTLTFYQNTFVTKKTDRSAYENISQGIHNVLKDDWDDEKEKTFQDAKAEFKNMDADFLHVIFDTKEFLKDYSELVFPKKERTPENLRKIAEIATIYGIDEKAMREIVPYCIEGEEQKLNLDTLKKKCMRTRKKYLHEESDPLNLPPRRYLEYRQNGASIANADKRLIEKLLLEYRLQPEVVNILLDTGLSKNKDNPRIVGTDIERMAGSWVRLGIDTREKALAQKEKELKPNSKYQRKAPITPMDEEMEEEVVLTLEERAALLKEMEDMKGSF